MGLEKSQFPDFVAFLLTVRQFSWGKGVLNNESLRFDLPKYGRVLPFLLGVHLGRVSKGWGWLAAPPFPPGYLNKCLLKRSPLLPPFTYYTRRKREEEEERVERR